MQCLTVGVLSMRATCRMWRINLISILFAHASNDADQNSMIPFIFSWTWSFETGKGPESFFLF